MQQIPIQAIPAQTLKANLGGQFCQIELFQKAEGLFASVSVNTVAIVSNIICRVGVPIVCRQYTGFYGNLIFVDLQGASDPTYSELNSRYILVYYEPQEA